MRLICMALATAVMIPADAGAQGGLAPPPPLVGQAEQLFLTHCLPNADDPSRALDGLLGSGAFETHQTAADGTITLHGANDQLVAQVVQGGAGHDRCAVRAGNIPGAKLKTGQSAARLATGLNLSLGREAPSLHYPAGAQIMHMGAHSIRVGQPAGTADVVEISLTKS